MIIAILAAMLLPALNKARARAHAIVVVTLLALCGIAFPQAALAVEVGDFELTCDGGGSPQEGSNNDYTYENGVLTIWSMTPMTVTMNSDLNSPSPSDPTATTDRIVVKAGSCKEGNYAQLTFAGVRIVTDQNITDSPVTVYAKNTDGINSALNLILADGTVNVLSSERAAALAVQGNANGSFDSALRISGSTGENAGVLLATTSKQTSSAIGGSIPGMAYPGSITIAGGVVKAENTASGAQGAGIGGANKYAARVTITGGRVSAKGYNPIGNGENGKGGSVTITGGMFVVGDTDAGTVYNIKPADGYEVRESGDPSFRYKVVAEGTQEPEPLSSGDLIFKTDDGTALTPSDDADAAYSFDSSTGVHTIRTTEHLTVTMRETLTHSAASSTADRPVTADRIVIAGGVWAGALGDPAKLTFKGVHMETVSVSAIELVENATVELTLAKDSENVFISTPAETPGESPSLKVIPGIAVSEDCMLTIFGEGALATSGFFDPASGRHGRIDFKGGCYSDDAWSADYPLDIYDLEIANGYYVGKNQSPVTSSEYPYQVLPIPESDFDITGGDYGIDYTFDETTRVLTVLTDTPLTIASLFEINISRK